MAASDETMPLHVADYTQTLPSQDVDDAPWHDDGELEELRRELREEVGKGTTLVAVPRREGWQVELDLDVDPVKYGRWEDNARRRRSDSVDPFKLAVQVLVGQCVNIWRRGEAKGFTFRDPELHDLLGIDARSSHRARDAVVAFYGGEKAGLDVLWTYSKWQEACGRDYDEQDVDDPT